LKAVIEREGPEIVIIGKQAIDDDCNQTGQMLAALLGWAQGTFASKITIDGERFEHLEQTHPYEAEAAVAFLDGVPDRAWAVRQAKRLGELVRDQRIVLLDPDHPEQARLAPGYAPGEYHLPHDFARRPGSLARTWFTEAEMDRSLRHLLDGQQEDGGWPISWAQWSPTSELEARPGVTLAALLTLRAYGRVPG